MQEKRNTILELIDEHPNVFADDLSAPVLSDEELRLAERQLGFAFPES